MCMYSRLSVVNPMTLSALTWCTCGSHLLTGLPSNWVSFRPLSINPTSTHNLLSTFLQLRSPIASCCSKPVLSFPCASPTSVSPMLSLAPAQGLKVFVLLLPPARTHTASWACRAPSPAALLHSPKLLPASEQGSNSNSSGNSAKASEPCSLLHAELARVSHPNDCPQLV